MAATKKNDKPDLPEHLPTGLPEASTNLSQWIMNNINLLHGRLGTIENRLVSLENTVKISAGFLLAVGVVWVILQFLLSNYEITFTPKP